MDLFLKVVLWGMLAVIAVLLIAQREKLVKVYEAIKRLYGEVAFEMSKVSWPSRHEVVNSTVLVGITAIILTVMVGIIDRILGDLVRLVF